MTVLGLQAASPPTVRRAGFAVALLRATRPEQWIKNLLIFAAPLAAGEMLRPHVMGGAALAFVVFTLAACSCYLVNDVVDVETDRKHPKKRLRPIASGDLHPRVALITAAVFAASAMSIAEFSGRRSLAIVIAIYLLVTAAYSSGLKRVAYLEILVVSSGFLLRALAGAVGTGVPPSRWFLAVCTLGALTVALGKRFAELSRVQLNVTEGRRVLLAYRRHWLARLRFLAASSTVAAYVGWALSGTEQASSLLALVSAVPLAAALAVYVRRNNAGGGEAPEQLLLHDHVMEKLAVTWVVLFVLAVQIG